MLRLESTITCSGVAAHQNKLYWQPYVHVNTHLTIIYMHTALGLNMQQQATRHHPTHVPRYPPPLLSPIGQAERSVICSTSTLHVHGNISIELLVTFSYIFIAGGHEVILYPLPTCPASIRCHRTMQHHTSP